MEGIPSRRGEKRSKQAHDVVDQEILGVVTRELAQGSGTGSAGRGRGGGRMPPRGGGGQGWGAGRGLRAHDDDGGREGKTIPAVVAPSTPLPS